MGRFPYVLIFERSIMSSVHSLGDRASFRIEAYFAAVGLRVARGAGYDLDGEAVWQVGPLGDHLHVLEFPTSRAVWRWWRDRVTAAPELDESDPFYVHVERQPGWLRDALRKNGDRVAESQSL